MSHPKVRCLQAPGAPPNPCLPEDDYLTLNLDPNFNIGEILTRVLTNYGKHNVRVSRQTK
jgi:hypothetical protein